MSSDILIRGGHVIDPYNGLNEIMDVVITDGRITDVGTRLSGVSVQTVIDASGKFVIPGMVDLHTHVANHLTPKLGIDADMHCLKLGTTTAVDAGSTGELILEPFREFVIKKSRTRILAFLNAESLGMVNYPVDLTQQKWEDLMLMEDEAYYPLFVNREATIKAVKENSSIIVGIKWAHHGPKSVRIASEIASESHVPLMLENHHMPDSMRHLHEGDIITHIYHNYHNPVVGRVDGMIDEGEGIFEEFYQAKKSGILFDVGHGNASFSWRVAELAIKEGLPPDVISTDLWQRNTEGPVFDLPTTMSKLMFLGMEFEDVIRAVTEAPARAMGREKEIGNLSPGVTADVVVLDSIKKKTPLVDSKREARSVDRILSVGKVIREGRVVV